ncbi:MAG: winged helix-turn-helix transcriptional regulator [Bacteroidota bacterium]
MKPLDYTLTFRTMDRYVQNFNDSKEQLGDKLRQSVIATAKEIIRIYGSFLMKAHKIKPLDGENLPPLLTNNVQLAKLTNSSSRTIQRHIHKLIEAGIIKEK